jgi:hypothetical protein
MPRERLVDEHTGPSTDDRRMMGTTGPIDDPQAATAGGWPCQVALSIAKLHPWAVEPALRTSW